MLDITNLQDDMTDSIEPHGNLLVELPIHEAAGPLIVQPDAILVAETLEKGAVLMCEIQYYAVGIACSSLRASGPAARRMLEFARLVPREHVAALYVDMPPLVVLQASQCANLGR